MKTNLKVAVTLVSILLAILVFNGNIVKASNNEIVEFKDENFKNVIIEAGYDENEDGELSKDEMEKIEDLSIFENNQIKNIYGIEYAINLKTLGISRTEISDITPLKNLTNLEDLYLDTNQITDITSLSNLVKLKMLTLGDNKITNITSLKNLVNIEFLVIGTNKITDVSPLAKLTKLHSLNLYANNISDISSLKNLTNIEVLNIMENKISDISVVKNLINLNGFYASKNSIKDISALSNLKNLNTLIIDNNNITDISSLPVEAILNSKQGEYIDIGYRVDITNNFIDFTQQKNKNIIEKFEKAGWLDDIKASYDHLILYSPQKELPKEETVTNIKLSNKETFIILNTNSNVIDRKTTLVAEKVTTGESYTKVKKVLGNQVEKFVLYDISLLANNKKVQPNGKVKVSIPLPKDFDKTRIVIYRVEDNENKIEYDTKIDNINSQQYITFETNHFSNYVLAEKATNTTQNNEERKKDETPKTGTVDIVGYLSIVTIISALGLIAFRKKK